MQRPVARRIVVRFAFSIAVLASAIGVRADQITGTTGNDAGPNGFWSFAPQPSAGEASPAASFSLYGSGQMRAMSMGAWSNPGSQDMFASQIIGGTFLIGGTESHPATVTINASDSSGNTLAMPSEFTDIVWAPDKLSLTPGFGAVAVTWTALTSGEYTVNATVIPSQLNSSVGLRSGSIGGSTGSSAPYSQTMNFKAGDTIGFVAPGTGTSDGNGPTPFDVSFSQSSVNPVPAPTNAVALIGVSAMGLFLAVPFLRQRRLKDSARKAVVVE
jgi:hypothetical protein